MSLQLLSSSSSTSLDGVITSSSINDDSGSSNSSTIIINNSNRIASQIYLQHLDPYILSGISLGIEVIFIPIFLGLVSFIAVFMTRKDIRKVMFDTISCTILMVKLQDSKVIALYLMGSFEIMTQVQNMTIILVIILFIANVFLNTVGMATGIVSTKKMTFLWYLVNILGGSAIVVMIVVITATAISYFIIKIRITFDFQTYLYFAVYIIFVVTVVFHGVISNIVGCAVFGVIRQRTSKHNKKANQQSLKKVVILQLGVNISALIQLFAGIFIALSSELLYLKLLFYFFNNIGILIFACLVFSLYHPLFTGAVKEINEMKEKSSQSGGDSSRNDQVKELSDKSALESRNTLSSKRKSGVRVSPRPQQQVGVKLLANDEKMEEKVNDQYPIIVQVNSEENLQENQSIVKEKPIGDNVENSNNV